MLLYLKDSFYADGCIANVITDEAAQQFKELSTATLGEAHMEVRKWPSNRPHLTDDNVTESKVLGVCWDSRLDRLSLPVKLVPSP